MISSLPRNIIIAENDHEQKDSDSQAERNSETKASSIAIQAISMTTEPKPVTLDSVHSSVHGSLTSVHGQDEHGIFGGSIGSLAMVSNIDGDDETKGNAYSRVSLHAIAPQSGAGESHHLSIQKDAVRKSSPVKSMKGSNSSLNKKKSSRLKNSIQPRDDASLEGDSEENDTSNVSVSELGDDDVDASKGSIKIKGSEISPNVKSSTINTKHRINNPQLLYESSTEERSKSFNPSSKLAEARSALGIEKSCSNSFANGSQSQIAPVSKESSMAKLDIKAKVAGEESSSISLSVSQGLPKRTNSTEKGVKPEEMSGLKGAGNFARPLLPAARKRTVSSASGISAYNMEFRSEKPSASERLGSQKASPTSSQDRRRNSDYEDDGLTAGERQLEPLKYSPSKKKNPERGSAGSLVKHKSIRSLRSLGIAKLSQDSLADGTPGSPRKKRRLKVANERAKMSRMSLLMYSWKKRFGLFLRKYEHGIIRVWASSLKFIESRFGTGVASYFLISRSLLLLNIILAILWTVTVTGVGLISMGDPLYADDRRETWGTAFSTNFRFNSTTFLGFFSGTGLWEATPLFYSSYRGVMYANTYRMDVAYVFCVLGSIGISFTVLLRKYVSRIHFIGSKYSHDSIILTIEENLGFEASMCENRDMQVELASIKYIRLPPSPLPRGIFR
jgi:hypothetical protein